MCIIVKFYKVNEFKQINTAILLYHVCRDLTQSSKTDAYLKFAYYKLIAYQVVSHKLKTQKEWPVFELYAYVLVNNFFTKPFSDRFLSIFHLDCFANMFYM